MTSNSCAPSQTRVCPRTRGECRRSIPPATARPRIYAPGYLKSNHISCISPDCPLVPTATVGEYRAGNPLCVGTPEKTVERLTDMETRGPAYSIHYFPKAAYDRSGIELFEREVTPALQ